MADFCRFSPILGEYGTLGGLRRRHRPPTTRTQRELHRRTATPTAKHGGPRRRHLLLLATSRPPKDAASNGGCRGHGVAPSGALGDMIAARRRRRGVYFLGDDADGLTRTCMRPLLRGLRRYRAFTFVANPYRRVLSAAALQKVSPPGGVVGPSTAPKAGRSPSSAAGSRSCAGTASTSRRRSTSPAPSTARRRSTSAARPTSSAACATCSRRRLRRRRAAARALCGARRPT